MLDPEPEPALLEEYSEPLTDTRPGFRMTEDLFKENGEFMPNFLRAENALVELAPLAPESAIEVGGLDPAR